MATGMMPNPTPQHQAVAQFNTPKAAIRETRTATLGPQSIKQHKAIISQPLARSW
jgi:hypothetical protein